MSNEPVHERIDANGLAISELNAKVADLLAQLEAVAAARPETPAEPQHPLGTTFEDPRLKVSNGTIYIDNGEGAYLVARPLAAARGGKGDALISGIAIPGAPEPEADAGESTE